MSERIEALKADAVDKMTAAYHRRLAREMHGAWRAGYPFLEVLIEHSMDKLGRGDLDDAFSVSTAFLPTRHPQNWADYSVGVERYDLRELEASDFKAAYDGMEDDG